MILAATSNNNKWCCYLKSIDTKQQLSINCKCCSIFDLKIGKAFLNIVIYSTTCRFYTCSNVLILMKQFYLTAFWDYLIESF